jgi:hypothetical protein
MNKKTAYRVSAIVIFSLVVIVAIIKTTILDNANRLCILAEGIDEPSCGYYFFMERIYRISKDSNISEEFLDYLSNNENLYLHDSYIRVLGVTGEHKALTHLENSLGFLQRAADNFPIMYYSIYSIGLIGDHRAVPFLENLLEKSNSVSELRILGFPTAVALFMLTGGNNYYFVNSAGERQTLIVTPRLSEARKVIVEAKGRKRTYREMIILDKIYRHPDW